MATHAPRHGSWKLHWPTPARTGEPFHDTAAGNYMYGGAPQNSAWGQAYKAGYPRFTLHPHPLLYPKGEQDLLGVIQTRAVSGRGLVYPRGYSGTAPMALQPVVEPTPPWEEGPSLPGMTQGSGF